MTIPHLLARTTQTHTATTTPTAPATPIKDLDPSSVSPGLSGFLATFGLAMALVVLFISMSRRVRRLEHRRRAAEAADQTPTAEN